MKRVCKILIIPVALAGLAFSFPALAQSPTPVAVTATPIAANGAAFVYGSYSIQLVDTSGNPLSNPAPWPVQTQFSGNLSSLGALAVSLYPNAAFLPIGNQWRFTVCSAPGSFSSFLDSYSQCYSTAVTVTSAGSYSAAISAGAPAIYWQNVQTGVGYFSSQISSALQAGVAAPLPGAVVSASQSNVGGTTQITVQNTSSDSGASSDFIANSDNATNTTYYADFGCNSSTYSQAAYNSGGADDCYVYASNGNFNIATAATGKSVTINAGGTTTAQTVATFAATAVTFAEPIAAPIYNTATNCAINSVSPGACGSAAAGAFVVPTSTASYTVNTTAVTAHSRILLTPITFAADLPSSPTCVIPLITTPWSVSGIVGGTSFSVALTSTTGTACFFYDIIN